MMDEKEIAQALRDALDTYAEGPLTTERVEAVVDAYTHAIAEKMSEGVVFEETGKGRWEDGYFSVVRIDGSGQYILPPTWAATLEKYHGQRVTVAVKEEE